MLHYASRTILKRTDTFLRIYEVVKGYFRSRDHIFVWAKLKKTEAGLIILLFPAL